MLLALVVLRAPPAAAADPEPQPSGEWVYLDNGHVRLGVKRTSGAAIGYFAPSGAGRNLINHHDHGRLVQQSYYGAEDGSDWAGKPWRWNPVQGGDYRGNASRVLELRVEPDADKLYARTRPKHWASGVELADVEMEQWIALDGPVAHVRYRMTYSGKASHPEWDQEIPAVFVDSTLDTLVRYDGDAPWTGGALTRSRPAFPNEYVAATENWAAYARLGPDQPEVALGAYVPVASRVTCYRFPGAGPDACSYFAPLTRFAITPGFTFEYDLYLAVGPLAKVRAAFAAVRAAREATLFEDRFDDNKLQDGWAWVRPIESASAIADGVLRVRPSSGTLWETDNTGSNLLLRPAPGDVPAYEVEVTVLPATGPAKSPGLYEQAGPLWYGDDDNYVKLCAEYYEDRWWVVLASERGGKAEYAQAKLEADGDVLEPVRLRLTIAPDGRAAGAFRALRAAEWTPAGSFERPDFANPRVGLLAQTGPDAPDRRVGFDDFLVRLPSK